MGIVSTEKLRRKKLGQLGACTRRFYRPLRNRWDTYETDQGSKKRGGREEGRWKEPRGTRRGPCHREYSLEFAVGVPGLVPSTPTERARSLLAPLFVIVYQDAVIFANELSPSAVLASLWSLRRSPGSSSSSRVSSNGPICESDRIPLASNESRERGNHEIAIAYFPSYSTSEDPLCSHHPYWRAWFGDSVMARVDHCSENML